MSYGDVLEKLSFVIVCQNDRLKVLEESIAALRREFQVVTRTCRSELARHASTSTRGMMLVHDLIDQIEELRRAETVGDNVPPHQAVVMIEAELAEMLERARKPKAS
jgi:hypothetical protein